MYLFVCLYVWSWLIIEAMLRSYLLFNLASQILLQLFARVLKIQLLTESMK